MPSRKMVGWYLFVAVIAAAFFSPRHTSLDELHLIATYFGFLLVAVSYYFITEK